MSTLFSINLPVEGGGGGSGTVTSVAMTVPSILSVSGSPITTSGTLAVTLATETANKVFAGPTSGGAATPTFRSLVTADMPAGTGTVTSVAQTVPAFLSVSGSPVTTSGTLAITANTQAANLILSGPTSGSAAVPTFKTPSNQFRITFDGGGATLTGTPFAYSDSQFSGTIVGLVVLGDQSGTITITAKKSSFSGFPGSLADITGGNNIVVTAAQKLSDTTLTGWTTSVTAGDCFEFKISGSVTSFQHVQLFLNIAGV